MRTTTIRSTGAAAVAAVLLASGAVAAGATFGARDAVAQPATPYATTTWGQVTLDSSVFGHGGDSVGQLEVSGDGIDQWDVSQGTGELLDSATGTAATNVTTGPQSALADTNGAYTQLLLPDSDVPWVQQLISRGGGTGGEHSVLQVATWNNRVQCNPPAGVVFLTATTAPTFLGQAVTAAAPTGPGEETTTLNFPGDYGDGISDVEVAVVIDQDRDDPYYGHMRTAYTATAQPLDADGAPVGDPVQLFDLVLGDVEVNCEEPQPSPSPSPSPTESPSPSPSPSPTAEPTPGPTEPPTPTTGPTEPPTPSEPTHGPGGDDGAPPPSGDQTALPVTGAGVVGLVLAGVFSVCAAIVALVLTRKRSV